MTVPDRGREGFRWVPLIPPLLLLVAFSIGALACSKAEPAQSLSVRPEWADYTTQTESFRIMLRVGPTVPMDVMQMGATMTAIDQGRPVNHHLEVHIFDRGSGTEVNELVPTVSITDAATGDSRELVADPHPSGEIPYVKACLLANHRVREPHFGDNLYLRDGSYTFNVGAGNETAVFEGIGVSDAG